MKLTFSHGASRDGPHKRFNNGFGGEVWRVIDLGREDPIVAVALPALVRAAAAYNLAKTEKAGRPKTTRA